MIELRGIRKSYGGRVALQSVDLVAPNASVTVLIGPSGCGKSTILRIVAGLIPSDAGQVLIEGRAMTPETALELRRRLGYVIQDGGLFPHLTARENVTLLAKHLGRSEPQIRNRLDELAKLARFPKDALDNYPGELSGGQRQRVGLMRALMLDPDVLLLDEPLGALDPLVRSSLQTDLKDIFKELNKTVLFVTHDMGEAAYLGDHIVLLRDGCIVQEGTLQEFQSRPTEAYVTDFLMAQRSFMAI